MTRERDLRLNLERMWREMEELIGTPFAEVGWRGGGPQTGFSPHVDVYYCERGEEPRAVVVAELPGVDPDSITLEVSGRDLVIAGERALQETDGRVYQQMEIERGPFKRVVELGADVVAESAQASYDDGILRVELPMRLSQVTTRVPIEKE